VRPICSRSTRLDARAARRLQDTGIAQTARDSLFPRGKKRWRFPEKGVSFRAMFEFKLYAVPVRPYAVLQPKHQHGR